MVEALLLLFVSVVFVSVVLVVVVDDEEEDSGVSAIDEAADGDAEKVPEPYNEIGRELVGVTLTLAPLGLDMLAAAPTERLVDVRMRPPEEPGAEPVDDVDSDEGDATMVRFTCDTSGMGGGGPSHSLELLLDGDMETVIAFINDLRVDCESSAVSVVVVADDDDDVLAVRLLVFADLGASELPPPPSAVEAPPVMPAMLGGSELCPSFCSCAK